MSYIDENKQEFGVKPVCSAPRVAPSTYHAAKAPPPSAHSVTDARLVEVVRAEHEANYGVDGARKPGKVVHRARHTFGAVAGRTLDAHRGLEGLGAWPHDTHHDPSQGRGPGR